MNDGVVTPPDSKVAAAAEGIDLSRAPRGELAASALVSAVARLGDLAERHYLELKAPPDLSSKPDKHKIAKFILGSANRLPVQAAEAFGGYGVMVIGVDAGEIRGVPAIGMLELSKVIKPFLGASGPNWDVVRVPVDESQNEVLVVLVDPPQWGQPPFIPRRGRRLEERANLLSCPTARRAKPPQTNLT